jgi:hypothetical protein
MPREGSSCAIGSSPKPGRGRIANSGCRHLDLTTFGTGPCNYSLPEIGERLNQAGYPTAVKGGLRIGRLLAIEFRYVDTHDELGCYLEILDFEAAGMQLPVRAPTEAFARWLARFRRSD